MKIIWRVFTSFRKLSKKSLKSCVRAKKIASCLRGFFWKRRSSNANRSHRRLESRAHLDNRSQSFLTVYLQLTGSDCTMKSFPPSTMKFAQHTLNLGISWPWNMHPKDAPIPAFGLCREE